VPTKLSDDSRASRSFVIACRAHDDQSINQIMGLRRSLDMRAEIIRNGLFLGLDARLLDTPSQHNTGDRASSMDPVPAGKRKIQ